MAIIMNNMTEFSWMKIYEYIFREYVKMACMFLWSIPFGLLSILLKLTDYIVSMSWKVFQPIKVKQLKSSWKQITDKIINVW